LPTPPLDRLLVALGRLGPRLLPAQPDPVEHPGEVPRVVRDPEPPQHEVGDQRQRPDLRAVPARLGPRLDEPAELLALVLIEPMLGAGERAGLQGLAPALAELLAPDVHDVLADAQTPRDGRHRPALLDQARGPHPAGLLLFLRHP